MDNDIQLISDGDGLAIIGNPTDVERFLAAEGLSAKDLPLPRLKSVASMGSAAAQAGSEIAANSSRWMKLTKESAQLVKKHGLRESSKSGLKTGVVKGQKGQIGGFIEFAKKPGSLLSNPAILAGRRASWRRWRCNRPWTKSPTTSPKSTRRSMTYCALRRTPCWRA
ncbi:hypothetical protein [Paractinoplanes rhizophilus]